MLRYAVDGAVLNAEEESRHRGACNAALGGMLSAFLEDRERTREAAPESVALAFEHADEVVREHRRRIERAYALTEPPCAAYALATEESVVAAWIEDDPSQTIPRSIAIGRLQSLLFPLTLREVVERGGVRHDTARDLVAAGVLLPVKGG